MYKTYEFLLFLFSFLFIPLDLFVWQEVALIGVFLYVSLYLKRSRWQLYPIYTVLAIRTFFFVYEFLFDDYESGKFRYPTLFTKIEHSTVWYILWVFLQMIGVLISFALAILVPMPTLPKLPNHLVGTSEHTLSTLLPLLN